jgi:hypothetical protein
VAGRGRPEHWGLENNLPQVSFHRWKKQFGQKEVIEAKRWKDLERESEELKKILSESLPKSEFSNSCAKKALNQASRRIFAFKPVDEGLGTCRKVCRILEVPRSSYWYRPKSRIKTAKCRVSMADSVTNVSL